jgi:hypothetical protein
MDCFAQAIENDRDVEICKWFLVWYVSFVGVGYVPQGRVPVRVRVVMSERGNNRELVCS